MKSAMMILACALGMTGGTILYYLIYFLGDNILWHNSIKKHSNYNFINVCGVIVDTKQFIWGKVSVIKYKKGNGTDAFACVDYRKSDRLTKEINIAVSSHDPWIAIRPDYIMKDRPCNVRIILFPVLAIVFDIMSCYTIHMLTHFLLWSIIIVFIVILLIYLLIFSRLYYKNLMRQIERKEVWEMSDQVQRRNGKI